MTLKEVREKMLAKAATSCLSPADVKRLQFDPYEENNELGVYPNLAGFKIPYFTLEGKVDPSFFRYRLLQTKPSKGWQSVTEEAEKPRRYTQPPDTQCGVYLPPLLGATWEEVAADPATPIIITEGELKAACACKIGFPTIGLGGVYNWRSSKNTQDLLPILEKFNWDGRDTTICFDSDDKTNPMVRMATSRLAYTLGRRHGLIKWASLPEGEDGTKQGLDDFIYAYVAAATPDVPYGCTTSKAQAAKQADAIASGSAALWQIFTDAEELGPGQELCRMNTEVAVIRSTGEIIELETGNVYSKSVFSDTIYRNRKFQAKLEENGRMVEKFAAVEWLADKHRTEVKALAYEPACNNMITEDGEFNTWYAQKWPLVPSKTVIAAKTGKKIPVSTAPWDKLFQQVFGSLSAEHQKWVKQWFAYPIQNPGTKMFTAMLVWGVEQGTGKTLVGELMQEIYGKNYGTVNHDQLIGKFTEWAENKQFICGDEISIGDKRGLAEKLKDMLTRRTVTIDIKNRKTYSVRDYINYYLTSNSEGAVYVANTDRRMFIHHVDRPPMPESEYTAISHWWRKQGGAARMFHYFLYEVDLTGFSPTAHAPITLAKQEMAVAGRSEVEDWAFDLVRNPDSVLKLDHQRYDLFRTEDLLGIFEAKDQRSRVGHKGLSAALAAAGAFKIANGQNGAVIHGARSRLWALRNVDRYRKMGAAEAGKAYMAERPDKDGFRERVGKSEKFASSVAKARTV